MIFQVRGNPAEKGAGVNHQQPKSTAIVDNKLVTLVKGIRWHSKGRGSFVATLRKPKKNQFIRTHQHLQYRYLGSGDMGRK